MHIAASPPVERAREGGGREVRIDGDLTAVEAGPKSSRKTAGNPESLLDGDQSHGKFAGSEDGDEISRLVPVESALDEPTVSEG